MKEKSLWINPRNSMRGWYHTPQEITNALQQKRMLNPMLDLTNACNLNCPYCYIEDKNSVRKKRVSNELNFNETKDIIDIFASLGAKTIDLVGAGEPLIDPYFEEIVRYIYHKYMVTTLFTNGVQLVKNPSLIQFLYKHNVTVVLKLNSFDDMKQDLFAGKKGYGKEMRRALKLLMQYGFNKKTPTRLAINTLAVQGNYCELIDIHRYCRQNNLYIITADYIPTGRTDQGEFVASSVLKSFNIEQQRNIQYLLKPLTQKQRINLQQALSNIDTSFDIAPVFCPAYYGGSACTQQLGLYVDILGNIWPCVARQWMENGKSMYTPLGNIRKGDDIKKIWLEHPYMELVRQRFNGGCPYKKVLGIGKTTGYFIQSFC